jgi:RNA polymerase sigma-70 factor (ECF subfamily)
MQTDAGDEVNEAGAGGGSFEAAYRGLYPLVVRTVYLVTFDASVSEEIAHEAFLRLWERMDGLGDRVNQKAWLMRVAINLAIDHKRRLLTWLRHGEPSPPPPDPAGVALSRLEREEVRRALLRLRPRERAVLALRFEQQLSFPEIGLTLGRPEATVKTWAHRALDKLARELAPGRETPTVGEAR